jgi:hypothetical protein
VNVHGVFCIACCLCCTVGHGTSVLQTLRCLLKGGAMMPVLSCLCCDAAAADKCMCYI